MIEIQEFLDELKFPIFIDGISFNRNEITRLSPRWWWSASKKVAFWRSKSRIRTLWWWRNLLEYNQCPRYERWYKARDYLNTGKCEDFPKNPDQRHNRRMNVYLLKSVIFGGCQ